MFKTQIKEKVKHVSLWLGGSPLKKANFSAFSHFCIALHWWISDQKEFSLFFQGATVWHSGNSVTCLISLLLSFELSPNNNQVSSEDVDLQTLVWGLFLKCWASRWGKLRENGERQLSVQDNNRWIFIFSSWGCAVTHWQKSKLNSRAYKKPI